MQLSSVKPIHCQKCVNMQAGKSAYTIKITKQIMSFIFRKAVENGLLLRNPAEFISLPQGTKAVRRSITETEKEHFLKCAIGNPDWHIFLASYYCGCRPIEARGLLKSDVQIINYKPMLHIRGTKSGNADRIVPIPEEFYSILKTKGSEFLGQVNKRNYYNKWNSLKNAMNISMGCKTYRNKVVPPFMLAEDFIPYNLRHTYCTNLQKAGVDIRVAQKLMGHADIKLTANIYTHVDMDSLIDAGEKLDVLQKGTTPNTTK